MNSNSKKFVPLILILFVIGVSMELSPLIILNRGNKAFNEPDGINSFSNFQTLEQSIISGAGYFLAGNSVFLALLNRIETTASPDKADFEELKSIFDRVFKNMSNAVYAYNSLVEKAEITPYDLTFVEKLVHFDYKSFKNQRGISGKAFNILWDLLEEGDVRGVFTKLCDDSVKILNELQVFKASVGVNQFPDLSKLWRLNQKFSETMLFGQYAAEIFYEVSE